MRGLRPTAASGRYALLLAAGLGAAVIAPVACSASSGAGGALPAGSGGGPLGEVTGGAQDASVSPSPDAAVLGTADSGGGAQEGASVPFEPLDAAGDGAEPGEAAVAPGDAATDAVSDGPVEAAGEAGVDAGAQAPSAFSLINTTVTTAVNGAGVTGFDPILANATIGLATTGSALSIRFDVGALTVGSVAFALDATYTHDENTAPFMLCGDDGAGTITSCATVLTAGKHTLTATPYSLTALGGTAGTPATLTFTISAGP